MASRRIGDEPLFELMMASLRLDELNSILIVLAMSAPVDLVCFVFRIRMLFLSF